MEVDLPYIVHQIQVLEGHDDRAWHIAWNPAKPLLASCSADKSVRMYAYASSLLTPAPSMSKSENVKFTHITTIPTGHTKTVRAVAWSPGGSTLATASFDANIGIWEQEADEDHDVDGPPKGEWECASLLEGHETECKSVAYSSTGTLLASCSRDKTVWIWEVHPDSDFECLGVLMEHSQDVKCVAWHPEEEILASASYDDTIKLYIDDPSDDWFCFLTLTGHTSTVWSLAWSPRKGYLASVSDDRTVRIWRRVAEHKWECALIFEGGERSVYSVTWGVGRVGNGDEYLGWIAAVGGDGCIRVWEISEGPQLEGSQFPAVEHKLVTKLSNAHGVNDVNSIVWCPREGFEDMFATAGDDGSVKIWRLSPV